MVLKFSRDSKYACPVISDIALSNVTVNIMVGKQPVKIDEFGTGSTATVSMTVCGTIFNCAVTFGMPQGHIIIYHNVTQLNDSSISSGLNMPHLMLGLSNTGNRYKCI